MLAYTTSQIRLTADPHMGSFKESVVTYLRIWRFTFGFDKKPYGDNSGYKHAVYSMCVFSLFVGVLSAFTAASNYISTAVHFNTMELRDHVCLL